MTVSAEQFQHWLKSREDEHLEFKEAKESYSYDKLAKYCAALANEEGGVIILGISSQIPRKVVGSRAFRNLTKTKAHLTEELHLRIEAEELPHPDGRVVVFHVPSRPIGIPIAYKGTYWMRRGEELVPMTEDMLRRIFAETTPDYSATLCSDATLEDLDPDAIEWFRRAWRRKSGNSAIDDLSVEQLLADSELIIDGKITYAALILLGKERSLGRHLSQAEVIYEYRSSEESIECAQRKEYRKGFFLYLDELWKLINAPERNPIQPIRQGLFVFDVPTFNEFAVREAILNAVSHRDYQLAGSIFVRQYPKRLEITSPGGFPPGVTADNLLWRQYPRNRRIAETLARCGLVERSGQGADRIYKACIEEGKPIPDFTGTDDYQVSISLSGQIRDPQFVQYLQEIATERSSPFSTEDLLVLHFVSQEEPIPERLKPRLHALLEEGAIERVGRGRGVRYLLSRRYYRMIGRGGTYTRRRGLDKETNKALLLKHINDNQDRGSPLRELREVLPMLSRNQVQGLLRELKAAGQVHKRGRTRGALWFPGPGDPHAEHGDKTSKSKKQ